MKKKNNKGFTLIELLVAVAIMLSILGVAIVSFVSISDRKKEEAWETVKGQIETAAEQYFKSNEYLFEGLGDNVNATISVGKLVADDYLNVVTDPRDGKKISYCSLVNVKKQNGVFTISTDTSFGEGGSNDEADCVTGNTMTISEVGGPDININDQCAYLGDDNWCRGWDGVEEKVNFDGIKITVISPDAIKIESDCNNVGCEVNSISNGIEFNDVNDTDKNGKKVTFIATGTNGAQTYAYKEYKIDKVAPNIGVNVESNKANYNNSKANIKYSAYDDSSLLKRLNFSIPGNTIKTYNSINYKEKYGTLTNENLVKTLTESSQTIAVKMEAKDYAGNIAVATKNYTTYAICKKENLNVKDTITGTEVCDPSGIYKRTDKILYNDSLATTYDCGDEDVIVNGVPCKKGCPNIIPLGTEGDNGWYKQGTLSLVHDGDSGYWTWYRDGNSLNSTSQSLTTGVLEGEHKYKLVGKHEENCNEETIKYDNTKPTCELEVQEGTKGNNGWYTSSMIKLKFKSYGDPSSTGITASGIKAYNISSSSTVNFDNPEDKNYEISKDCKNKDYYGYVKDKAGNENKCSIKINKDSEAPELDYFDSGNDYITEDLGKPNFTTVIDQSKNIKNHAVFMAWDVNETPRLSGTVEVKNKLLNICLPNERYGEKNGSYYFTLKAIYKDDFSGTKYSSYSVVADKVDRTTSPTTKDMKTNITVCDNAGNCRSNNNVSDYQITYAYILESGHSNTNSICNSEEYRKSFKTIFQDDYNAGKRTLPNLNP